MSMTNESEYNAGYEAKRAFAGNWSRRMDSPGVRFL